MSTAGPQDALRAEGLEKSYGAIKVTNGVSLRLRPGERHAVIGPNGAGKTTLVHLLSGLVRPSKGVVKLNGNDITRSSCEHRVKLGLVRTFQINSLFPQLTVAENIALAVAAHAGMSASFRDIDSVAPLSEATASMLDLCGLRSYATSPVAALSYGKRRLVDIALALALHPKVLLLDEPAAGLSTPETRSVFAALERLPADVAILLIEHDMDLVFNFARSITVLVEGRILVQGTPDEIRANREVRDVYLGRRAR
jgi:branched-chain amino acid transport system ATP-binding protein